MKRLYFDTETTGTIPKFPPPLIQCPHIVQIAAILVDDDKGEILSMVAIVKPDGWEIPEGAAAIHGITTEMALEYGMPLVVVMGYFSHLCRLADQIIAHNVEFDLGMVGFETSRLGKPNTSAALPNYCTMLGTKDICKIPGQYGDWKWPKLMEAYKHLFGEEFDGAHDALADLRASQRIHRHLIMIGAAPEMPPTLP